MLLAHCLSGCATQIDSSAVAASPTADKETLLVPAEMSGTIESEGFEGPEEALTAYLTGIKEMDFSKMLGSFAVESYVKNLDFQKNLEQNRGYTFSQVIKYPNSNSLLESINIESRRSSITQAITNQYLILGYSDFEEESDFQPDTRYAIDDEHTSETFLKEFSNFLEKVEPDSLKLLGFMPPETLSEVYGMETNLKAMARKAEIYGAEKIESCVAAFEIHGDKWLLCADTVKYDGKWYIMDLQGNIGQLFGIPISFAGTIPVIDWDSQWENKITPAH